MGDDDQLEAGEDVDAAANLLGAPTMITVGIPVLARPERAAKVYASL